ncbi:hypothetical protein KCU90_g13271, partial [Aureobasidium melanogenum]
EYIHRIGRTGRIGHTGHATSFYNERNEDLAPALVNILLETEQPVPDFLEQFKPENGQPDFTEDATDDEEEAEPGYVIAPGAGSSSEAPADAWGTTGATPAAADAWGAEAAATTTAEADAAW